MKLITLQNIADSNSDIARSIDSNSKAMVVTAKELDPTRVFKTHLSKLTPQECSSALARLPSGVSIPDSMLDASRYSALGSAIVNFYEKPSQESGEAKIKALVDKIHSVGQEYGLWGTSNAPMVLQSAIHVTLNSIILDRTAVVEVGERYNQISNSVDKMLKTMQSDQLTSTKLILSSIKLLPDGNFGLQFNCDIQQDIALTPQNLARVLAEKAECVSDDQLKVIKVNLDNPANGMKLENGNYNLSRLQFFRLKMALLGAEVKGWYPGTLMVLGWVKDAAAFKSHQNLPQFMLRVNQAVNAAIESGDHSHTLTDVREVISESRTHERQYRIDLQQKGTSVHLLKAQWLLSSALLPQAIMVLRCGEACYAKSMRRSNNDGPTAQLQNQFIDPRLSDRGKVMSAVLAQHVREQFGNDQSVLANVVILTSPLAHCIETAAAVSRELGKSMKDQQPIPVHIETSLSQADNKLRNFTRSYFKSKLVSPDLQPSGLASDALAAEKLQKLTTQTSVNPVRDKFELGHLNYISEFSTKTLPATPLEDIAEIYKRFTSSSEVRSPEKRCIKLTDALRSSPGLSSKYVIAITHGEICKMLGTMMSGGGVRDLPKSTPPWASISTFKKADDGLLRLDGALFNTQHLQNLDKF